MSFHLHIDPFSGLAGDMLLGALVDAGASLDAIIAALKPLPIDTPYRITTRRVHRLGIAATDLKVLVEGDDQPASHHTHTHTHEHTHGHGHGHGHSHDDHGHGPAGHHHDHDDTHVHARDHEHDAGHHHHHYHYRDIIALVDHLDVPEPRRVLARRVIQRLAEAEATVHGVPVEEIHLHEVGAVDSIVDMLGSIVALELLNITSISSGPLPISRGFVRCAHGKMPVPAPATAELMRGLSVDSVDRTMELVSPTGAALIAAMQPSFCPAPAMVTQAVGYGAGDRDTPDVPNVLRVFLGELSPRGPVRPTA